MSVGDKILSKNLMILASAGSGKTFQLGNRIIGLIGAREVEPERIVALTFTRKAAGEFADAVLTKLALAAVNDEKAEKMWDELGEKFPVGPVLENVVRALPRLQLGTMDGFFGRVVRGFQYELGLSGGTFEVIEGPRLVSAMTEILSGVLGNALEEDDGVEFLHAFRRATSGKEGQGVLESVEKFMQDWHGVWKAGVPEAGWGGGAVFGALPEVDAWEQQKSGLIAELRGAIDDKAVGKVLDLFAEHTVGSGKLGKTPVLFDRLAEAVAGTGAIEVKAGRKMLEFDSVQSEKWRSLFALAASCELAAAVARTGAVGALVQRLDEECRRRLRSRGLLGFDDVKNLMRAWTHSEEDRLRREAVDFRLDARYDHWLLDEFQDTSRGEWEGMEPLLDEAASGEDGSLFVVGDRKQAIYGWRGGDVSLFDRVEQRYGGDLEVCTMPESWRSCPAVLDLVNRVCGDLDTVRALFGAGMGGRWSWEEHVSARPEVTGHARVEEVAKDEMGSRMVELLRELGAGDRDLSCGVLVRTNPEVRAMAALLREEGFDVIEEGRRMPVEDNAVGVVLHHLLRWLADPADGYARELVAMSPLAAILEERFGESWLARWEGALAEAMQRGFAVMVESLIEPGWKGLSEFSRRRAGDVIGALAEFDGGAGVTAREARDWIAGLEISQAPGVAAVQVMTIHKSKGLGFDVVVLPGMADRQVPDRGKFSMARGGEGDEAWVLQPPAKWVRDLIPSLQNAEERWADDQRYEAICLLYVALTRAKRGLYVLLPELPTSRKKEGGEHFASLANWVRQSACDEDGSFQSGDADWMTTVEDRERKTPEASVELAAGVPKRKRATPSSHKGPTGGKGGTGRKVGLEVHALFEDIEWLARDEIPKLPRTQAGAIVEDLLRDEKCHAMFERPEDSSDAEELCLYREQAFEVLVDGRWMSGVIDRMLVVKDPSGKALRISIYDFKTDRVEIGEELRNAYREQMEAYVRAMTTVFDCEEVVGFLVSTALPEVLPMSENGGDPNGE